MFLCLQKVFFLRRSGWSRSAAGPQRSTRFTVLRSSGGYFCEGELL